MASLRLLVIDDDPMLRESLADGLHLLGDFDVIVATDGANGLEQVREYRPDGVIVDVRMPRLDGYQFIRSMRGDPATADIPIIVLSALSKDADRIHGELAGADAYLYKPVELSKLLRIITETLALTPQDRASRLQALSEGVRG